MLTSAFAKAARNVNSQSRESRAPQDHHVLFAWQNSVRQRIYSGKNDQLDESALTFLIG